MNQPGAMRKNNFGKNYANYGKAVLNKEDILTEV